MTDFDADFATARLCNADAGKSCDADGEISVSAQLYDADGQPVAWTADAAHAILFAGEAQSVILSGVVNTPAKWSAEDPYLYTLVLAEKSGEENGLRKLSGRFPQNDLQDECKRLV